MTIAESDDGSTIAASFCSSGSADVAPVNGPGRPFSGSSAALMNPTIACTTWSNCDSGFTK